MAEMVDSSFGRLIGALLWPRETFRSIRERPTWAAALLTLLAVQAGVFLVAFQHLDLSSVEERMAARGATMPLEQVKGFVLWIGLPVGLVTSAVFFLLAAAVFLGAFQLAGAPLPFRRSLSVTLHGLLPLAVASLLAIPVVATRSKVTPESLRSGAFLASNPGFFAPAGTGPVLRALLSSLDLFSLWSVILLVLGFRIATGTSRRNATWIVVGAWCVGVAVKIGFAALGAGMGRGGP